MRAVQLHVVDDVPVDDVDVEPAVVVGIEQLRAEAERQEPGAEPGISTTRLRTGLPPWFS
jgi:hypothetical protein